MNRLFLLFGLGASIKWNIHTPTINELGRVGWVLKQQKMYNTCRQKLKNSPCQLHGQQINEEEKHKGQYRPYGAHLELLSPDFCAVGVDARFSVTLLLLGMGVWNKTESQKSISFHNIFFCFSRLITIVRLIDETNKTSVLFFWSFLRFFSHSIIQKKEQALGKILIHVKSKVFLSTV